MPFLKVCIALYDYEANAEEELTIKENDILYLLEDDDPEWWKAKLKTEDPADVRTGLVPCTYVEPLQDIGTVVGAYKYDATTDEELSFEEGDTLTLYERDDPDWFLVGNGTHVGFVPGNYVEEAGAEGQAQAQDEAEQEPAEEHYQEDYAEEQQDYQEPEQIHVAAAAASPSGPTEKDDLKFWSVNEVDKKKKKKKGSLGVGNFTIYFGSEEDKSPVRQWSIKDVDKFRQEKKHVYLDLGGASPASFDFQAASKQEAEAIFAKIQDSKNKSRISRPVTANASAIPPPPNVRDSVASTSTYQTAPGSPGLRKPAAYSEPAYEEPQQAYEPEPEEPAPNCEGRWAIAMYDFQGETEEELTIHENDEVWVSDYVSSEEWWKCQVEDRVGIVPASYLRFADEEEPAQEQEVQQEEEVHQPVARAVPTPAAASIPAPPPFVPPTNARAIPVIPVAPPAPAATAVAATPAASASTSAAAAAPAKKVLTNTRMWTDRTGTFKVEAEYLGFHDGKISLHKLNGVKIAVPVSRMSQEDVAYVEKMTGQKISQEGFDWYDFFIKAGIATEDALRYSTVFRTEKMDSTILPELSRDVLKGLNVKEGDIIRIRKVINGGSGGGETSSPDQSKPKKSVSFAGSRQDVVNDREMALKMQADEVTQVRTASSTAEQRRQQELADEKMARELQERENAGNRVPVFGKKTDNSNRKTSRPKPTSSASSAVDVAQFTKLGSMLTTPTGSTSGSTSSSSNAAKGKASNPPPKTSQGFDDDAWEVRDPKLDAFDYDNWKVQNRDNEDEWIAKFASSTAPKPAPEDEVAPPKKKETKPAPLPTADLLNSPGPESSGSVQSAVLTPTSPAVVPPAAKPASSPVPGSLAALALTQKDEAEKVREQMQKIKDKQEADKVKQELEQVKAALVQQASQTQQLIQHIRRQAPPPPVSASGLQRTGGPVLPAPLVPVHPTGPPRFIPTHPTGQVQVPPVPAPYSTANMGLPSPQQQMMTGMNRPMMAQATGMGPIVSQPTGRANLANATPANPFGVGSVSVNGIGAPKATMPFQNTGRAPQLISPPMVPPPFINRNISSQGPPPPPPPMQNSMMTGFNNPNSMNAMAMRSQMTGMNNSNNMGNNNNMVNSNMTGMNNNMGGMNNGNANFQAPMATGMNSNMNNNMNNMNNNNNTSFQVPMSTGINTMGSMNSMSNNSPSMANRMNSPGMMNNGGNNSPGMNNNMVGINSNMTGMNNNNNMSMANNMTGMTSMSNNMTGMNANMTGMGGMNSMNSMNSNMTGMNNNNNNMSTGNQFNKSPMMSSSMSSLSSSTQFSSPGLGQSRILQSSGGSGFGGNSSFGNNSLSNNLGSNNNNSNNSPSVPMPLLSQQTGNMPMASSYRVSPSPNSMPSMNNNNMGGSMGMGGGMGNSMNSLNNGGMGGMNSNMTGMNNMGGMNNNSMGGMNNNNMSSMGNNMTGMNTMGGMGNNNNMGGMGNNNNMGGMNPQMTGMMGNNMMGNNNMNGMNNNMTGMGMGNNNMMNPNMTGMNNSMGNNMMNNNMMNNNNSNMGMNNNGQFGRY